MPKILVVTLFKITEVVVAKRMLEDEEVVLDVIYLNNVIFLHYLTKNEGKRRLEKSCCLVKYNNSGDGKRIKCNCCGEMLPLNEGIELFYVLNSLVTKTILGWVIISQLLVLIL